MDTSRIKLNTEWLSVCGGCHVSIVDLHEKLLRILDSVEIQRCPLLTDVKDYPRADIGILTGAIRTEHDLEAARKMRQSCDTLIAFGTCAVYGGIPGAALAHSPEEILEQVYLANPTTRSATVPRVQASGLQKQVVPIDEVIEVDLYLPGCPPQAAFIFDALVSLVEKRPPKSGRETVCARCSRIMKKTDQAGIRGLHEGIPDEQTCLLSQGYICLGSVTLDRCLAPCPNRAQVCTGCAGPSLPILTEPHRDIRTDVAKRMARLTAIDEATIIAAIERTAKSHYAYAMASRMVAEKPTFLIRRWIAQTEAP